jgi:hypothetical protein
MSASTLKALKFGCLTNTAPTKRFSGGALDNNFKLVPTTMYWFPFQIQSLDFEKNKATFKFFTKTCSKMYRGPDSSSMASLTLSKLCNQVFNDAEAGGVDTFLYCPDSKGNVLDMTEHHTRVTFEDAKKYVAACEGPILAPEYSDPHGMVKTTESICAYTKVFDDQALEDSSHLWQLIISYINPKLLIGIHEHLGNHTCRGPGLLMWMVLMDEVTSGSPQAMDGVLDRFQKLQLADYLGENVHLMVNDIQATYNILKDGSALPTTASSTMISKLLFLSVEEFCAIFYAALVTINKEKKSLLGCGHIAILKYQLTDYGVKGLCDLAVTHYKRLVDNGCWPPLSTVPKQQVDTLPEIFNTSAAMPSAFQAITDKLILL